ncbi:MAG: hypothetical protein ACYDH9_04195 [Limisphaerales bacterium]
MMSLLRILFGVLAGVGLLAGLAFLGQRFPVAARFAWCMVMGFGVSGFLTWFLFRCLRLGVTGGRFASYERSASPFHFWFYILLYLLLALFFFAFGVCSIVAPKVVGLG